MEQIPLLLPGYAGLFYFSLVNKKNPKQIIIVSNMIFLSSYYLLLVI